MSNASLQVVLTGTGYPRPDPKRAGPGCLVQAGGQKLQFDCGRSTVRRLAALGILPHDLQALFFTHYHSDHLTDLADMAISDWLFRRDKPPLRFVGPTGLHERLAAVERFLRADATRRGKHAGRTDALVLPGKEFPRPQSGETAVVYESEGVRVLAAAVQHGYVEEAVGFRVEHGGRAVAISGDCSYSPGVVALARGADLLVHEILSPTLLRGRIGPAAGAIADYHASPDQVARVASEAGVPKLVLTHIVPTPRNAEEEALFVDAVAQGYTGEVILGEDLMRITVPADD